jgi:hypothetical protein
MCQVAYVPVTGGRRKGERVTDEEPVEEYDRIATEDGPSDVKRRFSPGETTIEECCRGIRKLGGSGIC